MSTPQIPLQNMTPKLSVIGSVPTVGLVIETPTVEEGSSFLVKIKRMFVQLGVCSVRWTLDAPPGTYTGPSTGVETFPSGTTERAFAVQTLQLVGTQAVRPINIRLTENVGCDIDPNKSMASVLVQDKITEGLPTWWALPIRSNRTTAGGIAYLMASDLATKAAKYESDVAFADAGAGWVVPPDVTVSPPIIPPDPPVPPSGNEYPTPISGQIYNDLSETAAKAKIAVALPGDQINVADGVTLSGNLTISRSGTAANPIVIRAATNQGATIDGKVTITGAYVQLCRFKMADSTSTTPKTIKLAGRGCRAHRIFMKYNRSPGIEITGQGSYAEFCTIDGSGLTFPSGLTLAWEGVYMPGGTGLNAVVRRCRFMDGNLNPNDDYDMNAIGLAHSNPDVMGCGCVIEYNYITNWNGNAETIGIKQGGNLIRFNHGAGNRAYTNRNGESNKWHGNNFDGTLRCYDRGMEFIANKCRLELYAGSVNAETGEDPIGGNHRNCVNTLVARHNGVVVVGATHSGGNPFKCKNTTCEANENASITTNDAYIEGFTTRATSSTAAISPITLTGAVVGHLAPWDGGYVP